MRGHRITGNFKSDFQLDRNLLKEQIGDLINLLLAVAASNLSLWMSSKFPKISCGNQEC